MSFTSFTGSCGSGVDFSTFSYIIIVTPLLLNTALDMLAWKSDSLIDPRPRRSISDFIEERVESKLEGFEKDGVVLEWFCEIEGSIS